GNPLVIACVAGIVWNVARLPLPALAGRIVELLSSAALPLGLLAVGAGLRFEHGALPWPAFAWWSGVKLAALPTIALILADAARLSPLERQIAVIMAAVPTAPSAYILAVQMKGAGSPVALLISGGPLLSTAAAVARRSAISVATSGSTLAVSVLAVTTLPGAAFADAAPVEPETMRVAAAPIFPLSTARAVCAAPGQRIALATLDRI